MNFIQNIAGLTIFRGISAHDADKPNTVNSEISYAILSGNEARKFSLESKHSNKAVINLNRPLDFDGGDRFFNLTIRAQVRNASGYAGDFVKPREGRNLRNLFMSRYIVVLHWQECHGLCKVG